MLTTHASANRRPWFPYRLTGAIIGKPRRLMLLSPWFPYRLTGAIIPG